MKGKTFLHSLFFATALLAAIPGLSAEANNPVNINTASAEQLENIKGIGSKKAQAIVQYRKNNGSFTSVSDLTHVKGIGPGFIKKNGEKLTIK